MKLSKRLKHIEKLVDDQFDNIWDCCCDHGFLGTSLLRNQVAPTIHFVDIVPGIISNIENKLNQFYPELEASWKTHSLDVAKLPLEKFSGKHLIIIAGIGGDLLVRMIEALHKEHSQLEMDFLLCPVNRQFALREKLIELNFSLKEEILIEDKSRFYEVLLVSTEVNEYSKVSSVGDKIWQFDNDSQALVVQKYLDKTLKYYEGVKNSDDNNVEQIIAAYKKVILQ